MMESEKPEKRFEDPRLEFLANYTLKSLRLKPEKWSKLVSNEETCSITTKFLDDVRESVLVISLSLTMQLVPYLGFPASVKTKGVYFVRRIKSVATQDNMGMIFAWGDLGPRVSEQLGALIDTVLVPLLASPGNQVGWPPPVPQEVRGTAYAVRDGIQQALSAVRGHTLLPLPLGVDRVHQAEQDMRESNGLKIDQQLKGAIEGAVIQWVTQANKLLEQESGEAHGSERHPGPAAELQYWRARVSNLESVYEQIQDPRVHKMALILAGTDSAYYPSFAALFKNVVAALTEARSVSLHLSTLERYIDNVTNSELPEAANGPLKALMHTVCLVWAHCPHYRRAVRLTTLLKQICNLVIQQAKSYIDSGSLFQTEVEDINFRVKIIMETLKDFRELVEKHRSEIHTYFHDSEPFEWNVSPAVIFDRLSAFVTRLKLLQEYFSTAIEFRRLERVELEGTKGRALSSRVVQILSQFESLLSQFAATSYDALEPEDPSFEKDYRSFKKKVKDLERRLAVVFCHAFDECNTPASIYKFIDVGAVLLERSLIKPELDPKYTGLLDMLESELDTVEELYTSEVEIQKSGGGGQLDKNMPSVAGTLLWAEKLKGRVAEPISQFMILDHPLVQSPRAHKIQSRFDCLVSKLDSVGRTMFDEWADQVAKESHRNLQQPLLIRLPGSSRELALNFHPQLVSVLREVHYFKKLGGDLEDKIPPAALEVYARNETLRQYSANLTLAINWYNRIRRLSQPVEFRLIEGEIAEIDRSITDAQKTLTWDSSGVWEFITYLRDEAQQLESRLRTTQANIGRMRSVASAWAREPLFSRGKTKNPLPLPVPSIQHERGGSSESIENTRVGKRFKEVQEAGIEICTLIAENRNLFRKPQKSGEDRDNEETEENTKWQLLWQDYEDFVDDIISKCLQQAVGCSLNYLLEEMTPKKGATPLFEIKLSLNGSDMTFTPSLDSTRPHSFPVLVHGLLKDSAAMAALVPRVASRKRLPDYTADVNTNPDICEMQSDISARIAVAIQEAQEYACEFEMYSYLWLESREVFLEEFLRSGYRMIPDPETLEDQEQENENIEDQQDAMYSPDHEEEIEPGPPSIHNFREQIDAFATLQEEVGRIPDSREFQKWLRVDLRPFRQALINTAGQWGAMLRRHLERHVVSSLTELAAFIQDAEEGLIAAVKEGDFAALVKVMSYLRQIKGRAEITDEMFGPLQETLSLLASYEQEMPEEVHVLLEELPQQWKNLKLASELVRQQVAPFRAIQQEQLKRRIAAFEHAQVRHYETFRKSLFFKYECTDSYALLDTADKSLHELELQLSDIKESASLFEVIVPEMKPIMQCRREMKLAKQLWDYIEVVRASIDAWKTTPWKKIDVENMDIECKKFAKEIRMLDKEVRGCDAYLQLESTVRNMITSLRAVAELQSPAIRERHWEQLMRATKEQGFRMPEGFTVRFVMGEKTTLSELLALRLHQFEDEVRGIVEQAVKERGMEKVLKDLEATWDTMVFERDPQAGCLVLRASEELIETLEENQVQLQNLMGSKYIAYFLSEVSGWQTRLSNADQVISIWFEVQRTWLHLQSIFLASADIRLQLPEDSARFDEVNTDFRVLLEEMPTNVVEGTNRTGLYEKLECLQRKLTLCEKALAEYLETKRLAFPRFYFVSSADLLDILSNGNQPTLVARHLTKLFDSLAQLTFREGDSGGPKEIARGMSAKDGEHVDFHSDCECIGPVELWLGRLETHMRNTLRRYLGDAVTAYEEKPRDQWLFDYPAQVSLCGTQVWWTSEVSVAFHRLEEGYENALKDYQRKQVSQLNTLISLLLGELTRQERQKVMTVCTIDVHSRDVVAKLVQMRVESAQAFHWQSQLRHRWDDISQDCFINICDAQFHYAHEYLGNTPRLVITPLTDRCYITLTQSLHLVMGGAPAGPAGTGKTETTKDLGRALGMMVYVFNCSEQMDYQSCGNIYKGLAQTGAWGCFDEFNRISVEVLSVVAVQVKCLLDAIREKRERFNFQGDDIALVPSVGIFVTMNPGYAGRTELPENLKALFRPCAMVVPDFELICEIMLVAEGFQDARVLARKFITLYSLCRELLSKQDHYDWGLRAIKSVLVVAGSLKRGDRERPEEQVLMRALRDFNIPKIVADDVPVFMGLIGDLFPALDVPRKRDAEFERTVKQAAADLKLQPEDSFILKVVQLEELLQVRHSVFVVGGAGAGKTQVWRTLSKTYSNMKRRPVVADLNPKAVTNDDLFGVINPATREWKDGLFSAIMRDQANLPGDGPKWMVLDGDIDPMWIESLNTVMDDNKILTLASNERIAVTPSMRLLFEISNLRTATPATVSRAGILFLNPHDLGWSPFVTSWLETRPQHDRSTLQILFDKYLPNCVEIARGGRFRQVSPVTPGAMVQTLCRLLGCLLGPATTPADCPSDWYELYFVFACTWAFGGALPPEQASEFSKWWLCEFKSVRFPPDCSVFSVFIEPETKRLVPWKDRVPKFELDPDIPLLSTLVATSETTRLRYFLDLLMAERHPVMLVGGAGCGKSVLVQDRLAALPPETHMVANVPFNYYTTSEMLQKVLEKPLEKKAGRNYGPPGSKTLVYFIDDLNMPEVDAYGTVQPHTLLRQHLDYGHWYDRAKLTLKDIHNTQYVACMNPTAGSFTINPRLQRHFTVFALSFPETEALESIYLNILSQHIQSPHHQFGPAVFRAVPAVVSAALGLHARAAQVFLPTATKFHYIFSLRDLSNVFQGLLFSAGDSLQCGEDLARLWLHEAQRVYGDKMADDRDCDTFSKLLVDISKKYFEDMDEGALMAKPNVYCHFAGGLGESRYLPISGWESLSKLLKEALANYNELVAAMELVLFEDAMMHVCRINRILESPRGNALLVGVGGSGKQSLARLAAFISSLEVFQVQLRRGYAIADLKADLAALYLKAGLKNVGTVFIMTDAQVADERFLVLINDLLASGEVPELFADDEVDNIVASLRNEVKGMGLVDTRENCWRFFIDRVRRQLKVVLCFSPVGSTLRVRSRKFPALTSCSSIDWFHEWPQEALISVSSRFLADLEVLNSELRDPASQFLSHVHTSVNVASQAYLASARRHNYTTPKSFLEQIALYSTLLRNKDAELKARISRLENGLEKLRSTAAQVDGLKERLAEQEIEVQLKNEAADKLIHIVGVETEKVSKEKAVANKEEAKVALIAREVSKKQQDCEEDLVKAEPALVAAQEALNTLNKANLTELKSFGSPPEAVTNVTAAVLVLLSPEGKIPKDRSWKSAKMMMGKVDQFLDSLVNYKKEEIPPDVIKAIQPYLKDKEFKPDLIRSKSAAAAGLCAWVINIIKFFEVFCEVEPKRIALAEANAELAAAQEKLRCVKAQIESLEEMLAKLTAEFETATMEKLRCQQEADQTNYTIELANRLVNGLASENVRWAQAVASLRQQAETLPGDVLIVSAFISYVGCFTRKFRSDLLNEAWLPFLRKLQPPIPITEDLDPLLLLTDDAQVAAWNNEGLPADRMSTENATILTTSQRWPLMIDPQLQGLKWVKSRHGDKLQVLRLGQKGYLDLLEVALSAGITVLIENIGESVDAVLDPLLGRNLIKKGRAIRIGDKEVEYHSDFRLILHTKLANPHYKPEMQAQTTLVDFTVTRDGLEEQLLAEVVRAERPDLEQSKAELTKQQNEFKIKLKALEDALLLRLSSAGGDLLSDRALVENLETTKRTAAEISRKVAEGKITAQRIDEARELYRPAAQRAALLYFVLNDLHHINPVYQFSLKAFSVVFQKAIERAPASEDVSTRVKNLIDCITYSVFLYTTRGLFEADKLIFAAQMAFQILLVSGDIVPSELDLLLRFPTTPNLTSPFEFLSNVSWGAIKSLSSSEEFRNLDRDIEASPLRWKKFVESKCPERDKFPQEWKSKVSVQRLCMMRALRPDRMTYAVSVFIEEKLGSKYVTRHSVNFEQSFEETSPATPIFFILSPGVNPLKDVEELGRKLGFSSKRENFHSVSLGQGQEIVAERAMAKAAKQGHWVVLQNIHLVRTWLNKLEKRLEQLAEEAHPEYRVFMSAEPAPTPESHILPQGILETSIKITNEPPTGMQANLQKALSTFTQDTLEMCSKEAEFKQILFGLCYFHAVVAERRKFGPQGWNRVYPFNVGDLTISMNVLYNYLEANTRVPWEDLRYLFGEIMYGGHITDDWDRRLCRTYLEEYMQPDLVEGELQLAPGFCSPPNTDMVGLQQYVLECLPPESPLLYGLHPNAEIGFLTATSESLLKTVFEMQPRDAGAIAGGTSISREDKVKLVVDELLEKLPEGFNMIELNGRVEERSPYVVVACQECERMNLLTNEMRRSLKELELGLKGELTITADMEELEAALFLDQVPNSWSRLAYPSLLGLGAWFSDLLMRLRELESWTSDFVLPASVWLAGFFNPQSFLTAIMQSTARRYEWPLDKMCLFCEVTKRHREDVLSPPREGAFVHGLFMEGARWDVETGIIAESRLKELCPPMPVMAIKAITQDKQDLRGIYECPVYKTRGRGPTYVWTFNLRSKEKPSKWTLAGVALLLQI